MPTLLARALTVALLSVCSPAGVHAGDITVDDPFARASAGSVKVGAAYMIVKNSGAAADALVAAESPVAARAELHTHIEDGEVMRMRQVSSIDVPAGGTVSLQPGGLHIMLIDLKQPLRQGETFPLTLTFAKAGRLAVDVPVKSPAEMGSMPEHQH